jgi:hypothetical protein
MAISPWREEALLPLDDGLADAQDGVEALLDVLDEPARLLQPRGSPAALDAAALAAERPGVQVVDAQLGHHVGVERGFQPRPAFCTITSGTTMLASAR